MCIQEHWLASYESDQVTTNRNHCTVTKCFDDDNFSLPTHRSKGQAGVAVLWKKDIDRYITSLPDGSNRVQVIQIATTETPVTIINTYMPTERSLDKSTDYDSVLDEVYEITSKYKDHSTVIWLGDINASFNRQHCTTNDKALIKFCQETGFVQAEGTPNKPTYHHFVRNIKSQIDHILQLTSQQKITSRIFIEERIPINLSSHDAICASLDVKLELSKNKNGSDSSSGQPISPRVNWKKVDKEKYAAITDLKYECLLNNLENLPSEIILQRLHDIMITSAKEATINSKRHSKRNKKNIWPSIIIVLAKQMKKCFAKWKAKGRPSEDDITTKELDMAKKKLKSAKRQIIAIRRKEYLTDIMESCEKGDMKFFSLIRKQRQSKNATFMQFPDANDDQDAPVDELQEWVQYFTKLATPNNEPHFDDEFQHKIEFKNCS